MFFLENNCLLWICIANWVEVVTTSNMSRNTPKIMTKHSTGHMSENFSVTCEISIAHRPGFHSAHCSPLLRIYKRLVRPPGWLVTRHYRLLLQAISHHHQQWQAHRHDHCHSGVRNRKCGAKRSGLADGCSSVNESQNHVECCWRCSLPSLVYSNVCKLSPERCGLIRTYQYRRLFGFNKNYSL
jgi:hypothetical protein